MRSANEKASISKKYQKKTTREHILLRSAMYVGQMEKTEHKTWAVDESGHMGVHTLEFAPAVLKLFGEIVENSFDNIARGGTKRIDVVVRDGGFQVKNDGDTVPVEKHEEHGIYIPEMVFGHFLTGSNYDDEEVRENIGGLNGYGAKLVNVFSKKFSVLCEDAKAKKAYGKTWFDNMSRTGLPSIERFTRKNSLTTVFAEIDWQRFGCDTMPDDVARAFKRRVYDLAATTPPHVRVSFNGELVKVRHFQDYCALFGKHAFVKLSDMCEVAVFEAKGEVQPPKFVNGVLCPSGTHVDAVGRPLYKEISEIVKRKMKLEISPYKVARHVWLAINCSVPNPAFSSQTKEKLTTPIAKTAWCWNKSALKRAADVVMASVEKMASKEATRKLAAAVGSAKSHINIKKLDDANFAGTKRSSECSLVLTEGDSAKALAVAGMSVVGRDTFGAFPLKGKLLNVRDCPHKKLMANKEIQNVMKILGLKPGDTTTDHLRYGRIIIMADQDHDGSHIKGLVINMFATFWPELVEKGYVWVFATPIVKATKGKQVEMFFDLLEFHKWEEDHPGWKTKYYKGLGTSDSREGKEYFRNIDRHLYKVHANQGWKTHVDLAFNKARANDRKEWLVDVPKQVGRTDNVSDFINKELIQFSNADNLRSIPSICDGFKPSQRKVMFAAMKRKAGEVKVAQFAAYVAEKTAYHHGEASLCATIINMAAKYVGSSNMQMMVPAGQFGTRLQGGHDAASPRYIFTEMSKDAKFVFRKEDMDVLKQQVEEGHPIEPETLAPILPIILVNGAQGIGTGWATNIPPHNPEDLAKIIISNIELGTELVCPPPSWVGFKGKVDMYEGTTKGICVRKKARHFLITELPVGTWTQPYKEWIKEQDFVSAVRENSTEEKVDMRVITKVDMTLREFEEKARMLKSYRTQWVAFDTQGKIKKYENGSAILKEYAQYRLDVYNRRIKHQIQLANNQLAAMRRKLVFLKLVVVDKIDLRDEHLLEQELKKKDVCAPYDDLFGMQVRQVVGKSIQTVEMRMAETEQQIKALERTSAGEEWVRELRERYTLDSSKRARE